MKRIRFMRAALAAAAMLIVAGGVGIGLALADGPHGGSHMTPMQTSGGAGEMALGDQEFIRMMISHHQMAMDMAQLALTRAEHQEVRRLAKRIIRSQGGEVDQMTAWYEAWYGDEPEPEPMDPMHMGMSMSLDELAKAQPFDRAFLAQMIPHHASAIVMASQLQPTHPELGGLASGIIAAQAREIGTMQRWRSTWYPPLG